MGTVVIPTKPGTWTLRDRLGRALGTFKESSEGEGEVWIKPAAGKLPGVKTGPFASLDLAMAEIETHTGAACQITTGM